MSFRVGDAFVDVEWRYKDPAGGIEKALAGKDRSVKVGADTTPAEASLARFAERASRVKVDADTGSLDRKLALLAAKQIKVDADTDAAGKKLDLLEALAQSATGDKKLKVDADIAAARAKLAALDVEAQQLDASRANITVDVDSGGAQAQLAAAEVATSALNGRQANVTVDANVGGALAKIAAVAAALGGLGAIAGAGIGAAAGIGAVAAGGIGAFAAAMTGVGGAVKELGKQNQAAGGSAGGSASNHNALASAMDRVKSAQLALTNARLDSASAARRSTEEVANAQRGLVDAERQAGVAATQASQRVTSAAQREQSAVESLARAQADLTQARKDAARQIEDLESRTRQLALSEREAQLGVQDTKAALDRLGSRADDEARARAQLAYDEAVQRLQDIHTEQSRAAQDKADADKKGVDGSDLVLSAQERILAAQREMVAAQQALNDARANESVVAQKSAQEIADAQRRVADAQAASADQRRHSEQSVAQATQAVVEAQRAVQQASQAAGGGGSAAMNKLNTAMAALSPTGQKFAVFLRGFLDGPIARLRREGQDNLLPGLQRGLEDLEPILDRQVTPALGKFSKVLGEGLGAAIPIAGRLGASLLNFGTSSLRGLAPLEGVLTRFEARLSATFTRLEQSGDAEKAMNSLVDVLGAFLEVIPPLIENGTKLMAALGPGLTAVARELGGQISALVQLFVDWSPQINTVLTAIAPLAPALIAGGIAFFGMRRAASGIIGTLKDVGGAFGRLGKSAGEGEAATSRLSGVMARFGAAVAIVGALDAVAHSGDQAAASLNQTRAALLDLKTSGSADALDKIFKATSNYGEDDVRGFTDALDRLANPGLNGRLNSLASTLSVGLIKSGQEGMAQQLHQVGQELASMVSSGNGAQAQAIFEQLAAKAATVGVSVDQLNGYMPEYQDALLGVKNETRDTSTATDRLDSAIRRVTGGFLSGREAESRYYDTLQRVTDAVRTNGKTMDVHTQAGRANRQALDDQAKASLDYIQSLQAQNAPHAQVLTALAASRASLIQSGIRLGLTKDQAKAYADQILKTPTQAVTTVKVNGVATATASLDALISRIAYVNGKLATLQVNAGAANVREDRTAVPKRAKGGPVEKGMPYIVGDGGNGSGAELFVPEQSGRIIPDFGLLRRGVAAPAATQFEAKTTNASGGVTIQNLTIQMPATMGDLSLMSASDRVKAARAIRDELVKLEGATR